MKSHTNCEHHQNCTSGPRKSDPGTSDDEVSNRRPRPRREMRTGRDAKPARPPRRRGGLDSRLEKSLNARVPRDFPWKLVGHLLSDLAQWLPDEDVRRCQAVIRSRNVDEYLSLKVRWGLQSINSDHVLYTPEVACKYLLSAVISKYPFEGREKEKVEAALRNVEQAEVSCSHFNRSGWRSLFLDGHPTNELLAMQSFVQMVVGPLVPYGTTVTDGTRHGPGSDTATSLGHVSTYYKYAEWPYHVTAGAWVRARQLIQQDERWLGALEDSYRARFQLKTWEILDWEAFWDRVLMKVNTNRITTVPKDGVKHRPIAIEPRMNLMLQLGVAGYFQRRLKKFGVALDSQVKNQQMAKDGSIRKDADAPCTLDLSNASDTVSLRLVKLLFPRDWFLYLCELRAPKGVLPSKKILRYSKVSSMGNGFTFALESVCFSAIAYAVSMHVYGSWRTDLFSVYGDDLIVPKAAVDMMLSLLRCCGFTVNQEKSFTTGPVRESCGADWFRGTYVRPVYLKSPIENVTDLYAIRNLIRRWSHHILGGDLVQTEQFLLSYIPENLKLYGPVTDDEFSSYLHTADRGIYKNSTYHFKCIQCRPRRFAGRDFLFRKLMHDLRPAPVEPPWTVDRLRKLRPVSGSRFIVTHRDKLTYVLCSRQTPEWGAEYRSPDSAYASRNAG